MRPISDPYRLLGVPRGASLDQIKAAHRSLAKRYHPDSSQGDTDRFLAIQEAYQTLSDPLRRRAWDARHHPGPVRAGDGPLRDRRRRAASGQGSSTDARTRSSGTAQGAADDPGPGGATASAASPRSEEARHRSGWAGPDRDPGERQGTWSAHNVPWWEDFTPRAGGPPADAGDRGPGPGQPPGRSAEGDRSAHEDEPTLDFDVYSRSSGAAWSQAARAYFRRGDRELPRHGVFQRRGTQPVSGAVAREVAAQEAREARREAEAQQRRETEADRRRHAEARERRHAEARDRTETSEQTAPEPAPDPSPGESSTVSSQTVDDGRSEGSAEDHGSAPDRDRSPNVNRSASARLDPHRLDPGLLGRGRRMAPQAAAWAVQPWMVGARPWVLLLVAIVLIAAVAAVTLSPSFV